MGEILGLGITHYPSLAFKGNLARRINMLLDDPAARAPALPEGWPEPMREQWPTTRARRIRPPTARR